MSGGGRHFLAGARVAVGRPGLVSLHAGLDLLWTVMLLAPLALGIIVLAETLLRALPLALLALEPALIGDAMLARLTAPGVALPLIGLAMAGALLAGVLRIFFLSGALGVLSRDLTKRAPPGEFMDNALARFPSGLGAGALLVLVLVLVVGWVGGLVWAGGVLYSRGVAEGGGGSAVGAIALALAITALIAAAVGLDVVRRLTLVRALAVGDGPAAAMWEAVSLALRRPGSVLLIVLLAAGAQVLVGVVIALTLTPLSMLPVGSAGGGEWVLAAQATAWFIRLLAFALVGLAAYGAFTSLVMEDAGLLPGPERQQAPIDRLVASPVPSRPLVARPIEETGLPPEGWSSPVRQETDDATRPGPLEGQGSPAPRGSEPSADESPSVVDEEEEGL